MSSARRLAGTRRRRAPAASAAWAIIAALVLAATRAHAALEGLELDDETGGDASLARRAELNDRPAPEERATAPLWLELGATIGHGRDGIPAFGGALLLTVPFDRLAHARSALIAAGPRAAPDADRARAPGLVLVPVPVPAAPTASATTSGPTGADRAVSDARARSASEPAPKTDPPPIPLSIPPPTRVSPARAREAIRAALARAGLTEPGARIDALAGRARIAALLPELRLRASRTIDEGQALSPTEYDPGRVTATSGVSLWLEARATFRLDRLVFADEEVALERLRAQRLEAQSKLVERVLGLLFAWQRACLREADAAATEEERLAATLKHAEAEVELDVLTGGSFTRSGGAP